MLERQNFIDNLEVHAKKIHEQLTHGKENLKIIYNQNVKTDFSKELLSRQDHDIFRHQTSVGPHRDDLQFFLSMRSMLLILVVKDNNEPLLSQLN